MSQGDLGNQADMNQNSTLALSESLNHIKKQEFVRMKIMNEWYLIGSGGGGCGESGTDVTGSGQKKTVLADESSKVRLAPGSHEISALLCLRLTLRPVYCAVPIVLWSIMSD